MALSDRVKRALREISEILRPRDAQFTDLLLAQADCAAQAVQALVAYLDRPDPMLEQQIADLEEHGDNILADIQRALREALVTPLSGSDINYLGTAIDDLLDQFEDMAVEDAALQAAGIGAQPYDEPHYRAVLSALSRAVSLLPTAVRAVLKQPKAAEGAIREMRAAYNEGKRAYSLAYAALLQGGQSASFSRIENRLRWLRLHLRRVEKLANAFAGILANT